MTLKTPGHAAHDAFFEACGLDHLMGEWDDPAVRRDAWDAAAKAAADQVITQVNMNLIVERDQMGARVTELEASLTGALGERDTLEQQLAALADRWSAAAASPGDVADDPDAYDLTTRAMWDLRAHLYRNHAAALRKLADHQAQCGCDGQPPADLDAAATQDCP